MRAYSFESEGHAIPSLDGHATLSPGAPGAPTEDRENEVLRNLDQQVGLIGS
jgi:hypothetical protein